ncbi:hypothetical protein LJR194_000712 [Acidovorax sp. LjRoot194]
MGNCVGCVLPKTSPLLSPPNNRPETDEEGWFDKFKQGAKDAAQYYKDNISESMHEFGANAMDTGGKVAMAGGATAAAGGMVAATGIGAPVGVAMGAAGGAAATAGGVVGAVGAGTDTAATALDAAATWITEGKAPDLVQPALALGERLLTNMVLKKVPGLGAGGNGNKDKGGGSGSGGGYIPGVLGPCLVGSYHAIKDACVAQGGQTHHIVADKTFGTTARKSREQDIGRIPGKGGVSAQNFDAPSICLQGNAKTAGTQHNTAHQADAKVKVLGDQKDNGPQGTAPMGEIIKIYEKAAIAARPDCKEQIENAVKKGFRNVDKNQSGRTTDSLPKGESKEHLEQGQKAPRRNGTKR